MEESSILSFALLISIFRGATPLIYAAMAGMFSERSGVVQIALEGMMLMGALIGAIVAHFTGNPWLGFLAGGIAGILVATLKGFFVLVLKSDQIVTGTAINILALGTAPFITKIFFNSTGSTPSLSAQAHFTYAPLVLAFLLAGFLVYWQKQTRAALWMEFAGEAPEALQAAGQSVSRLRWTAMGICGFLAGLGGASLSLCLSSNYSPNMTAGRGYMALAALIVGKWRPLPTLLACVLFAVADAIQIRLQGSETGIPVQFIQVLPYLITIVALAGFFGKSQAPKALGRSL